VRPIGALLWLLLLLASCSTRCGGGAELAELAARVGSEVERDEARSQGAWHEASLGTRFSVGDGLRTGAQSSAELALLPSGSALVAPHSIVRFMATPPSSPTHHVSLEIGAVEIAAEQIDLEIHTPRALARVSRGSKLKLSMRDGREVFDLVVGRVVLAHAGVKRVLEPARPLAVTDQDRVVAAEPATPLAPASEPDGGAIANTPPPVTDAGDQRDAATLLREDAGSATLSPVPSATALRLTTLESATLHVSSAPVDVFLPASGCAQPAELRIDGKVFALGGPGAGVQLDAGTHQARVTCGDGSRREARLVVKRDPARLELPKRAQSVRVEADGRRYTVRYQNLLPDLTFVWPGEVEEGDFTLLVRTGKRELRRALEQPEHVLAGSVLGEGEHKFWFRDRSGRSSKPTTVRLEFDNAARSAYLSLPLEGGPADQNPVTVEGAALVASAVAVEGSAALLDAQGRFRQQIQLARGQRAVSVRVEHPSSGIHYYLRRLR
jgi:hypothetical protein